mgnify:CR=1 FL=1|jgi:hypothetical protein
MIQSFSQDLPEFEVEQADSLEALRQALSHLGKAGG